MKLTSIVQIFTPFSGGYLSVELAPTIPGMEWTLDKNPFHYTLESNLCHYSLDANPMHWTMSKED